MATAYAALASLLNVLNRAQHPAYTASLDKSQIQSLFVKTSSLIDVLEASSHAISDDLKRKMMASAFAAGDWIESYLIESIQKSTCGGRETSGSLFSQDLDKAIQEMESIMQEAGQANEQNSDEQFQQATSSLPVGSPAVPRGDSVKAVGLDEEVNRLMGQLTAGESSRQFIPIVGMGGLGKTTLATNVYHHPHVKRQFDVRAWVTISQVYTARTIMDPLLRDIGVSDTKKIEDGELGLRLHQGLLGRTYLIVIDDIWDVGAWDEISRFCPNDTCDSRIVLTTRNKNVADSIGSCSPFELQLLDVGRSWDLLSTTVFGQEACPPQLEHCGKEIARKCDGLPLAVVVIGGLLHMSIRTLEHWEHVERNVSSVISAEEGDHCMKILSLSYHHLPIHLKPCFLFMASFSEDYEIRVSELTKLWVADEFLKPKPGNKTLEDNALECLHELVNRNLLIVTKWSRRGEIAYLILHDLIRDLCLKEAQNEMCRCGENCVFDTIPHEVDYNYFFDYISSPSLIRLGWKSLSNPQLDMHDALFYYTNLYHVGSMMMFVNVRFLKIALDYSKLCRMSISLLSNLETLIVEVDYSSFDDETRLPCQVWELRHIKHLIFTSISRRFAHYALFPDPPTESDVILENLRTLVGVDITSEEMLVRIPNVKKLKVKCIKSFAPRFDHFHKLEVLHFSGQQSRSVPLFPNHLRKLTLERTEFPWEYMKLLVGSLSNLEYLELGTLSFRGKEWKSIEGEFPRLTHLKIRNCRTLERWTAEEDCSHFPCLQHLTLVVMRKLEEIPPVFAEVMTLQSIHLFRCSKSSIKSAKQIVEEQQQSMANYDLIVTAVFNCNDEYLTQLKAELEEGFPLNDNFRVMTSKEYQRSQLKDH